MFGFMLHANYTGLLLCVQMCNKEVKSTPRAHWLEAIIYPHEREKLESLVDELGYDWVSILHDMDTKEGGEMKDSHVHLLCHFQNARTCSALAKDLMIAANRVTAKDNGAGALAYLTHNTDRARLDGKYQYPYDALQGPLREAAVVAADNAKGRADEGRQVIDLLDWIDSQEGYISVREVARWAAKEGRWSVFRRAGIIFKTVIEEHNYTVTQQNEREVDGSIWEKLDVVRADDPDAMKKLRVKQGLEELGIVQEVV